MSSVVCEGKLSNALLKVYIASILLRIWNRLATEQLNFNQLYTIARTVVQSTNNCQLPNTTDHGLFAYPQNPSETAPYMLASIMIC